MWVFLSARSFEGTIYYGMYAKGITYCTINNQKPLRTQTQTQAYTSFCSMFLKKQRIYTNSDYYQTCSRVNLCETRLDSFVVRLGYTVASLANAARTHFPDPLLSPRPPPQNVGPPSMPHAAIVSRLVLKASNEYGEYDPAGLSLYGIEMVVEPYRETTLTTTASGKSKDSRFFWRVVKADASGAPAAAAEEEEGEKEDPVLAFDAEGGSEITVTLTSPGSAFLVTVEELRADGVVLARGSSTASCKYVRRELRDLTVLDRTEFLESVEAYFKTSDEEGLAKYGEGFSNYERLTAYHNSAVRAREALGGKSFPSPTYSFFFIL